MFLFTSDGHRYTIDEFHGQQMALRMVTLEPDPLYVEGESKAFFNIPIMNPNNIGDICTNGITCYPASIFYSITQVPFIAINHYFHIITTDTLVLSIDDFTSPHYIFWRNSENVDLVFMELFYAPFFSAFATAIFFLICLEYKFSRNTSIILTFLLAFSTMIWAYSNTSLNSIPTLFFLLLGYLFYKKFQRLHQSKFILFSSSSLAFAFLIRQDVVLFIFPIWIYFFISVLKRNEKIKFIIFYTLPLVFSYYINNLMPSLRFHSSNEISIGSLGEGIFIFGRLLSSNVSQIFTGLFGLLFSPGVGLFIFSPLLLTIFFSFPDFFRKNKSDCLLFLSFFIITLWYHANLTYWHGLVAWGPRYLLLTIPFLLIPLGASLEKRNKRFMFLLIAILSTLGIFFNISYVIQDVSWFVWGVPGSNVGLFGLGTIQSDLWINDIVIWTFQYSQLTQSILLMFQGLQQDIYLLHLFGPFIYSILLIFSISFFIYLLWRVLRKKSNFESIKL